MKVLVIGSGGREHALCWKLAHSEGVELHCAPGNPGIAQLANTYGTEAYLALAEKLRPALTIVGPEAPLAQGIADAFHDRGLPILAPTAAAARLETSKAFTKEILDQARVPTARYQTATSAQQARDLLRTFGLPVVLKADGLAAGKGVVVARTSEDAEAAIGSLLSISGRILVEEFLEGEEVSVIALTDGVRILPFEPAQDHKALLDGDKGPNTGGMGAYSDSRILRESERGRIMDTILEPVVAGMRAAGVPFTGFLFAGLMMTSEGPKVLEFNARLGDPETQALLPRLSSDLLPFLEAAAHGSLDQTPLEWSTGAAVCVVAAARGYPGDPITGDVITGVDEAAPAQVFQAGTQMDGNVLKTRGGRVLGVTAAAGTLPEAIERAYRGLSRVRFAGMQFRTDIGHKGLRRWESGGAE